ncbi:flagellar biosynthesis protein FlhA [Treponema sp.]|uniref:flagellar biosynthesis protein FlhA n=1 Tax=Treponema sp. TaxID=166 RepID=UPI002600C6A8|nr:flagellar biosynthesis protein FlhA [Treponema sp.]
MPELQASSSKSAFSFIGGNGVAVLVVLFMLFMFLPLGKTFIDIAMVLNVAFAILILLKVVNTKRAADFSAFPQIVLIFTLFGLSINISSTVNILRNPVTGSGSNLRFPGQSEMVQTFANIVAGDSVLIGAVVFIILIVVQMLVITKGADRVSEVTARFTLDAMNTKMFAIQQQQNSGAISEEEAQAKISGLQQEIDFYSAMDGSSKFVSGNVKFGIFVTVINIIGGIITGMVMGKLNISDALNSYAKLTIGDGLMSQFPSLMLSYATGLLITKSSSEIGIDAQLKKQLASDGSIYMITGLVLILMGLFFHNASSAYLIPAGGLLIFFGYRLNQVNAAKVIKEKAEAAAEEKGSAKKAASRGEISPAVLPDALSLEIGYALIPLVDADKGAELLERVTKIRREQAIDLGLVVPPIHIVDQMSLAPEEYCFKIEDVPVGGSKLKLGYYMCLDSGSVAPGNEIKGEPTVDPAFGMKAIWLPESKRLEAEKAGYAVIDPPTIIATHLTEIIRRNAKDILSRQGVKDIIDEVKKTSPAVVDEVMGGSNPFTYGEIEAVLKNLLKELVSIRNMVKILETLSDFGKYTKDPWVLTEKVREALGSQICMQYVDENSTLHVLQLSQELAEKIYAKRGQSEGQEPVVAFDPVEGRNFIAAVSSQVSQVRERNYLPVIICPSQVRALVKSATSREMPGLIVLSVNEIVAAGPNVKVEVLGEIV